MVEEEMFTESVKCGISDGGDGVSFEVVSSEEESEVPLTSSTRVIEVNPQDLGSNLVDDRK